MGLAGLPHNVHVEIVRHLELPDKLRLAYSCTLFYKTVVPQIYSRLLYLSNETVCPKNFDVELISDQYTLIGKHRLAKLLRALSQTSCLNFQYADLVIELLLQDAESESKTLIEWREHCPHFPNLVRYKFPESVVISPLSHLQAPNLETLRVDMNFCRETEKHNGMVSFVNLVQLRRLVFAGKLGPNEDMVIFKLLTTYPHAMKRLTELRFEVDSESGDRAYRRVVGVMAIWRKMGLLFNNLTKLALPLTNHSTAVVLNLISKHVHLEHLTSLELFIEDDGGVLNLINTTQHLASLLRSKSQNLRELSIHYRLVKPDSEKNHLRSIMLLKLTETFKNLRKLAIDLKVEGLDLSNLLMMVGTPLSNNTSSLRDFRLNIDTPSENLVGNLLNNLDDVHDLFPQLNYVYDCSCENCRRLCDKMAHLPPAIVKEAIRVSTMMIIGNELDYFQRQTDTSKPFARFFRSDLGTNGYLFDHFAGRQLNSSLKVFPNLKIFEVCGLIYHRCGTEFKLLFGRPYTGLSWESEASVVEMGLVLSGTL
ncbi:hypothetical protein KL911_003201 [Ogataea haglerorum]|uniref:uncharacterized protein n=1 Tax=Ogataea haglerorum TaxID=1937702 RepID=UPI001C8A98B0|nr:uncharacterized protein KL911_003201 [Ogataea haglerorum]KAG7753096.1 hypothetical protein KL911_003201 [Ogataea haglerorum]